MMQLNKQSYRYECWPNFAIHYSFMGSCYLNQRRRIKNYYVLHFLNVLGSPFTPHLTNNSSIKLSVPHYWGFVPSEISIRMDYSTGMHSLRNQIQHKTCAWSPFHSFDSVNNSYQWKSLFCPLTKCIASIKYLQVS